VSARLRALLTAALAGALPPGTAPAQPFEAAFAACRDLADAAARLTCYDGLRVPGAGLVFRGHGSGVTDVFEVTEPRLLAFESDDAIMVIYLLDAEGRVVQNLHRGGAGGGRYLIETPGAYHVQVNASGGWTITVEVP